MLKPVPILFLFSSIVQIQGDGNASMSLICRGERKLVLQFQNLPFSNLTMEVTDESFTRRNEFSELPSIYEINRLKSSTWYTIRVIFGNETDENEVTSMFQTLSRGFNLSQMSFANVTGIVPKEKGLSVIFVWSPVPEQICDYDILIWPSGELHVSQISPQYHELYNIELEDFMYLTNYSIGIYPYTEEEDGPKYWVNFTTPSCSDVYANNETFCSPSDPEDLEIKQNDCEVEITWKRPLFNPDLFILDIWSQNKHLSLKIDGNTTFYSTNVQDFGESFSVHLKSKSDSGLSRTVSKTFQNLCFIEDKDYKAILIGTLIGLLILLVLFYIIFIWVVKTKRNLKLALESPDIKVKKELKFEEDSEYEIIKDQIDLFEIIGEGEFGVVHRANFNYEKGKLKNVAVKVLKENATLEDKMHFVKEVEVMKRVATHTNIVSLIGYCSSQFLLVVEYCSLGNLQTFLRNVWKSKMLLRDITKMNAEGIPIEHGVSNFLYDKTDLENIRFSLTVMELVSFARQIAIGMEYLSKNRVIHRDLAARNVLLTSNLTAKISDFGLSRDVYEKNMYKKNSGTKLPIKWMAIESLIHHIFTTQSDVWSFGILMWEILTLGCCPYPSLLSGQICKLLLQGYRMERPSACSEELYDIMLSCWDAVPQKRPSFSLLVKKLDAILESESPNKYLQLECSQYIELF